jgi:YidC/Oxa1 family membrane protein insertase
MPEFINTAFLEVLNFFAQLFGGSYGFAIIAVTLVIRIILLPIIIPSIKSQKKIYDLKPELDKLKTKHGSDKQLLSQKQMELYKKHNINPLSGCLPQIVQLLLFLAFYQVLISSLKSDAATPYSLQFFWLNLSSPDRTFVLPVLAGVTQLLLGLMLLPAASTDAEKKLALQTKSKKDDKSAQDMGEMAKTMQSQMVIIMPVLTAVLALNFPSGLALYWVVSTLFSIIQQYYVSGLGGLKQYLSKLGINSN